MGTDHEIVAHSGYDFNVAKLFILGAFRHSRFIRAALSTTFWERTPRKSSRDSMQPWLRLSSCTLPEPAVWWARLLVMPDFLRWSRRGAESSDILPSWLGAEKYVVLHRSGLRSRGHPAV